LITVAVTVCLGKTESKRQMRETFPFADARYFSSVFSDPSRRDGFDTKPCEPIRLAPLYLGCAAALDRYLAALPAMSLIPFAPLR